MARSFYGAVDIGASRIRAGVFMVERDASIRASLLALREAPFPAEGEPGAAAAGLLSTAARDAGVKRLEAVGVASIGPLDYERGWVRGAPNAPRPEFPVRSPIEAELGVPVYLENDVNAAAWGEHVLGRGRGLASLAFVAVGTGIGGGVVVGGRLLRGPRGLAAEVGHMVVDPWSRLRCGCGGLGHWEALASGSGLPRAARLLALEWRGPETPALRLARDGRLGYPELAAHAGGGDAFASHLLDWLARVHAAGIAGLAAAYDPDAVFLGGGALLALWGLLEGRLRIALRELAPYRRLPRLERATYGGLAGLYGALAVAVEEPGPC